MGTVYKAEDTRLKRNVALKFLPPELTHDPESKERFIREAQAAAALSHPNICTIHEIDEEEGKTFITMEYIDGQSIKEKVKEDPRELEEVLDIAIQVAEGLEEAHRKGIIHRDIKSANIMVTEKGQAKIMDFGLARLAGGTLVTKEGTTMGTIAYMSPEQARGEEVDHRTDIWSLGVVLYEMFSGQLPFKGEHDQAVVYSVLNERPKTITDLRSDVPMAIEQVVGKALEKNPDVRYQHIEDLLDDLESISEGIVPERVKARLRKAKLLRRKRAILYAGIAGFLIIMTVIALSLFTGRAEAIDSIAVLPFENLTGDAGQEYFVDGATDELIGQLAKIGALRVISRRSVMQYKGVEKSLAEIVQELKVDAVVEGTVYQVGENVRVRVQLIDVLPEEQNLWADTYDRPMTDVLVMYSEMARAIANKTQVNLSAEEMTRLTSASQVNPESYDAYLKGKPHLDKLTPSGLKIALQYFELALEIDPNNALAHMGVSRVWAYRQQMGITPRHEAMPLREAALEKALELDNTLAEAHAALAGYRCWGEWDWKGAETAFRRAIELSPNYPDPRAFYSHFLNMMRRPEEAMAQMERALELDPLNSLFQALYGVDLMIVRRYDDAIAQFQKVLSTVPNHGVALNIIWITFHNKGMYEEALAGAKAWYAATGYREVEEALARGYAEGGYRRAMLRAAESLEAASDTTYVLPWEIAELYLLAGKNDRALEWIERSVEARDSNIVYMGVLPEFESLWEDPRFQDLLRRMNLPEQE